MGTWTNADGLHLVYGTEKAEVGVIGEHKFDGPRRLVEIRFDSARLLDYFPGEVADDAGELVISDKVALPVGAFIEAVEVVTSTAWDSAGDALVLNVGTIDMDRSSNGNHDSLIDAATQAELITGGTNVAGWVGALVGTVLTTAKLITWEVNGAESTAGEGVIRIYYSVP
jgi:hypothetical protein